MLTELWGENLKRMNTLNLKILEIIKLILAEKLLN